MDTLPTHTALSSNVMPTQRPTPSTIRPMDTEHMPLHTPLDSHTLPDTLPTHTALSSNVMPTQRPTPSTIIPMDTEHMPLHTPLDSPMLPDTLPTHTALSSSVMPTPRPRSMDTTHMSLLLTLDTLLPLPMQDI